MPRIINTRYAVRVKQGRGMVDGKRLSMCCSKDEQVEAAPQQLDESKKEQMSEIINKLSKIKIINPKNTAKAKQEIKNKYIVI